MRLVLVSYVVRLVAEELAEGRLVGDVEAVVTGERKAIRGPEELLRFCMGHLPESQAPPASA